MAADMNSLAAGLDGHVVRFGIWSKGLRKTWRISFFFSWVNSHSITDTVATAPLNITTRLSTSPIFRYHERFLHRSPTLPFFFPLLITLD
jgi:hypothetical protein